MSGELSEGYGCLVMFQMLFVKLIKALKNLTVL